MRTEQEKQARAQHRANDRPMPAMREPIENHPGIDAPRRSMTVGMRGAIIDRRLRIFWSFLLAVVKRLRIAINVVLHW